MPRTKNYLMAHGPSTSRKVEKRAPVNSLLGRERSEALEL